MATTPPAPPFLPARAYPRLKYETPIVIKFAGRSVMGTTEDIAIGGLGIRSQAPPPNAAELSLLFNLPTGSSVQANAIVRYVLRRRFGVQFTGLPVEAHDALAEYTQRMLGAVRRGDRVAKRLHVTLRGTTAGSESEQMAETVILSRNGGRLICRARFKIGEELRLQWPEKHREARVRVVFRQLCGADELTDLGFEFIDEQDFWGPLR